MNVGGIEYTVSVEAAQSIEAARTFDKSMQDVERSAKRADSGIKDLSNGFTGLAGAIKAVLAAAVVREMAGWVQSYKAMRERIADATDSLAEFEMVQARLKETASDTYRPLAEAQEVYIQSSRALKNMGYETAEALDITDSLSYAFVRNATSADRANSAMNALVSATNTGKVNAMQWQQVMAATPTILQNVAQATGKTEAEIAELGYSGKLTADMLTEGLRKARDENKEAAAVMATDLTDAGVRMKEAIVSVLDQMEQQTGALQAFTDGIATAAEYIAAFSNDNEKMASFMLLAETAAASLAAVIAGRLLQSIGASSAALYQNTIAANAKAAANLEAARAGAVEAAAALQQAAAAERAAVGLGHHAQAAAALKVAEDAATAATARLTAAQAGMASAMGITTMAVNTLKAAMAALGGWPGMILLAAAAFVTLGRDASMTADEVDQLTDQVDKLGTKTLEYQRIKLEETLREQEQEAAKLERKYKDMERQLASGVTRSESFRRKTAETAAQMEQAKESAIRYAGALAAVNGELDKRASGADVGPQRPEGWKPSGGRSGGGASAESEGFTKLNKALNDQIALASKAGRERAMLAAQQKLGADATQDEIDKVRELAGKLYDVEQASKGAASSTKSRVREDTTAADAAAANAKVLADLTEQLNQAGMSATELAQRQAELMLNDYATPEQIEQVRQLALQLEQARYEAKTFEQEQRRLAQMAKDAIAADPRTAAENQYEEKLAQLKEFKENELITELQYLELMNAAHTQYEQDRIAAQEEIFRAQSEWHAMSLDMMDTFGQAGAQALSGIVSGAKSGKEAVQQMAETIANKALGALIDMGIQQAKNALMGKVNAAAAAATAATTGAAMAASYAPAAAAASTASFGTAATSGMAAMASAIPAMIGMLVSGSRRSGGPVGADQMYRVNEGGAPELFQNNLGQQFMIPNTRGEVVSNKGALGGGNVTVNLHEDASKAGQSQRSQMDEQAVIDIFVSNILQDGPAADAMQGKYGLATVGR